MTSSSGDVDSDFRLARELNIIRTPVCQRYQFDRELISGLVDAIVLYIRCEFAKWQRERALGNTRDVRRDKLAPMARRLEDTADQIINLLRDRSLGPILLKTMADQLPDDDEEMIVHVEDQTGPFDPELNVIGARGYYYPVLGKDETSYAQNPVNALSSLKRAKKAPREQVVIERAVDRMRRLSRALAAISEGGSQPSDLSEIPRNPEKWFVHRVFQELRCFREQRDGDPEVTSARARAEIACDVFRCFGKNTAHISDSSKIGSWQLIGGTSGRESEFTLHLAERSFSRSNLDKIYSEAAPAALER